MSDDLDALLARADLHMPSKDLRRAVENLRADYLAALDVIARLRSRRWLPLVTAGALAAAGYDDPDKTVWIPLKPNGQRDRTTCAQPMTPAERAVLDAAQRATHRSGT